ncbi:MAG: hypothetical protein JNM80_01870 [Phycisphaerae bacterium]|nr:hypothetical protein [Phycisphaerae bacterium]
MRWPVTNLDQVRALVSAAEARCPCCRSRLRREDGEACPVCGAAILATSLRIRRERSGPRGASVGWLLALNVALALLAIGLSVAQGGRMPVFVWIAPAVLGAGVFGLRYWPVFVMRWPDDVEVERGFLWVLAGAQAAGALAMVL